MATLVDDWVETNARSSQPGAPSVSPAPQMGAMGAAGDVGAAPIFALEPFDQQFARWERPDLEGAVMHLMSSLPRRPTSAAASAWQF